MVVVFVENTTIRQRIENIVSNRNLADFEKEIYTIILTQELKLLDHRKRHAVVDFAFEQLQNDNNFFLENHHLR